MNRRSFIASLLATAALDPEKLLWVPGKKTIFIPRPALVDARIVGNVREIILCNVSVAERNATIYVVPKGKSPTPANAAINKIAIPANTTVQFLFKMLLEEGSTLHGVADAPDSVILRSSWIEFGGASPFMKSQAPRLLDTSASAYYTVGDA